MIKQHNRPRIFTLCCLVIALFAMLAYGALNICPKCGYENASGVTKCTHCAAQYALSPDKEKIPEKTVNNAPEMVKSSDKDAYPMPALEVENEIKRASDAFKREKPMLACLYVLNALAMVELVDPAERDPKWGEPLVKNLALIEKRIHEAREVCPICKGSGRKKIESIGIGGTRTTRESSVSKCERCGGKGRVNRMQSLNKIKILMGQSQTEYERLQRATGRVEEGKGWIPAAVAAKLTLRQRVGVRRMMAPPCTECLGIGRSSCAACDGASVETCRARCDNGLVEPSETEAKTRRLGESDDRRVRCKACNGMGEVACSKCRSMGGELCDECEGSGKADRCSRCGGTGIADCRKCRGSGIYKDEECAACEGVGEIFCTGCRGCGKRVR